MTKYVITILSSLLLVGCHALNFQTQPKVLPDCQYQTLTGDEFYLKPLTGSAIMQGYSDIYVAQSKSSAKLSVKYQGIKGKLTDNIIERYYPPVYFMKHRFSLFRTSWFDDHDDYFYLSPVQRTALQRRQHIIFQQAILQNCQIVYIAIDSTTQNSASIKLITNK